MPPKGKLSFTTNLAEMAAAVDFIQENIPEQLDLKQRVLADASRHASPDVIIASSTSGLTPTDLQRDMRALQAANVDLTGTLQRHQHDLTNL